MKLARWCGLLLVPAAFAAVVVPDNAQALDKEEIIAKNADYLQEAIEAAEALANPLVTHMDFLVFLDKARIATNKAIHDETIRLQMEDGPTNVYELLNMIFSTEAIEAAQMHSAGNENPVQGLINGAAGIFNQISSGVTTFLGNGRTGGSNAPPPNIMVPSRNVTLGGGPITGFLDSLAFVTNDTGRVLNELTGGILTADVLNKGLDLVTVTIDDFTHGRVDLGGAINRVYDYFTGVFGAENPLGKFIQNLATYLSNNQDGVLANGIRLYTFINAAIITIGAIVFNSISNIVGGVTKSVYNFFIGIVNTLLGGYLGRLGKADFVADMYTAQAIDPTSIAQQFINLVNKAVQKVLSADPYILANLLNPTEANITKLVNTVTKVLTDKA